MRDDLAELMKQAQEIMNTPDVQEEQTSQVGITACDLADIEDGTFNIDDEMLIDICTYCGNSGKGMKGEIPCPECGREYKRATLAIEDYPTYINVPERYKNNNWDRNKVHNIPRINFMDEKVKKNIPIWTGMLEGILDKAKNNQLFRDSYLISGPEGLAKTIWAFTLIKYLYRNNVMVSPIMLLNDIDAYSNDITKYQVLVLNVTKFNFTTHIDKLDYILHKRKLMDLPTIVISSIPYSNFVSPIDQELLYFNEIIALK